MSVRLPLAALIWLTAACAAPAHQAVAPTAGTPLSAAAMQLREFPAPGAALAFIENGTVRFHEVGVERLGGPAVTRDTVFQLASLTKPFTAIVILRLADEGRIRLDDRAAQWLGWLPDAYRDVTLRQLLGHVSGVPRDLRRENVDEFGIDEFQRRFIAAAPSFVPGERWEYSNAGYTLLAMVAERAGGRDFGRLLEAFVFRPAGMRRTRYRAPLLSAPGRAAGHDWQEGSWTPAPAVYSGFGNSGIESTSRDLAAFALALHQGRLLRPESVAAMLAPTALGSGQAASFPFRGAATSYGMGWFLSDICGARVATHGGTIAGFSANLSWVPQRRLSVVALSNGKSGPDRIGIADRLASAALRTALACPSSS
jgi:CubicO group peptidase (beta-lactamase class C family)